MYMHVYILAQPYTIITIKILETNSQKSTTCRLTTTDPVWLGR